MTRYAPMRAASASASSVVLCRFWTACTPSRALCHQANYQLVGVKTKALLASWPTEEHCFTCPAHTACMFYQDELPSRYQ